MSVTPTAAGAPRRVLVNGLSIGTGGVYTVGRELNRAMADARPDWRLTLAVIRDHPLHRELEHDPLPGNVEVLWTPAANAARPARLRYERTELVAHVDGGAYAGVVQLNGMVLPGLRTPTLAHFQDPFPYRPEAWTSLK